MQWKERRGLLHVADEACVELWDRLEKLGNKRLKLMS
jgi:hypothetical protein